VEKFDLRWAARLIAVSDEWVIFPLRLSDRKVIRLHRVATNKTDGLVVLPFIGL
jgi:hypothetical protein